MYVIIAIANFSKIMFLVFSAGQVDVPSLIFLNCCFNCCRDDFSCTVQETIANQSLNSTVTVMQWSIF